MQLRFCLLTRVEARYTTKWPGYILPIAAQTVEEVSIAWDHITLNLLNKLVVFLLGC
jgi:hypothetical protein